MSSTKTPLDIKDLSLEELSLLESLSLEGALLPYDFYLRRFTLFKRTYLDTPVVHDLSKLTVPKFSTYHFVDMDGIQSGPQYADPLLASAPGIKYIVHVSALYRPEGTPIKIPGANIDMLKTEYRRFNRMIKPVVDTNPIERDDRGLLIFNYAMLAMTWRYPANFRAEYYKWANVYRTLYHNVVEVLKHSTRNQYIDLNLPARIPSLAKLREYARTKSTESLKYLREPGDFTIADLFVWCGELRENSLLSMIHEDQYSKVNFIVRKNNGWVVLNLGWLNTLRESGAVPPKLLEVKFLMMLNKISDITNTFSVVSEDPSQDIDVLTSELPESAIDAKGHADDLATVLSSGFVDDMDHEGGLLDDVAELAKTEKELDALDIAREDAVNQNFIDDEHDEDTARYAVDGFIHEQLHDKGILSKADELLNKNSITAAAYNRLLRISERFEDLPDPYGGDELLKDAMTIKDEDLLITPRKIGDDPVITDKAMTESRVEAYQRGYIKQLYRKDIMNCIAAIQKFPVAITDYKVIDRSDALSSIEEHVVKLVPATGKPSVLRIPVFKLDEDGTFLYSNTRYRQRNQRADVPIRKISPTEVVLTAYASKNFISRSSRSRFNYGKWITDFLLNEAKDIDSTVISKPNIATVVRYDIPLPWMYTVIASCLASFEVKGTEYVFDYNRRVKRLALTEAELKLEKKGSVIVGRYNGGLIIMQHDDELVLVTNGVEEPFDTFDSLLGFESSKTPLPMAEMKIYAKMIPMGIVLGYLMGLSNLLKLLRTSVRRALPGERLNLSAYEYVIRFKNETLVLDSRDRRATLIMSGWSHYHNSIKQYDVGLFDHPDVYAPVLERESVQFRYLKELDAMNTGFVDPITESLLRNMGEPTEYVPLLIRAVELLTDEHVPVKRDDPKGLIELNERIRGYERIPGTVYEVLYKAMRVYSNKATRSDATISINPQDVINAIISDPTVAPINNINPVHSLREKEVVTFGGKGGRSKRAMVAKTRLYTNEDKGFISEASVDSGDVGVITYLAPNANLTTLRGTVRMYNEKRDGKSMLFSSAVQVAPAADGDVPKRVGFISIQLGHQIGTVESDVQSYRTGAERLMIARMEKQFGQVAKGDGVVKKRTDKQLVVEYKDGTTDSFRIGAIEVSAEGTYYPHTLTSTLKEGDVVKAGRVLFYNSSFFKPSPLDPNKVDYTFGLDAFVAFREANYTIEDSCAISDRFSNRLRTNVTKVTSKAVNFDQEISNSLRVGDKVDLNTVLFRIEDPFTHAMEEDELAQALRHYSAMTPTAGVVGTINRVEVFYNGVVDNMSESIRKLTMFSEKVRKDEAGYENKPFYPNAVNRYVRIDGKQIESNQALIVYHITLELGMGVSDKLVFANQLKSTVGKVLFGRNETLDGEALDAIFGALSGINRTVTSVYKTGGVNTYLRYVGEEAFEMFTQKP